MMKLGKQNKIRHTEILDHQLAVAEIYALNYWFPLAGPNAATLSAHGEFHKHTCYCAFP